MGFGDLLNGVTAHPADAVSTSSRATKVLGAFYAEAGYCLDKFDGIALGFSIFLCWRVRDAYSYPATVTNNVVQNLYLAPSLLFDLLELLPVSRIAGDAGTRRREWDFTPPV